MSKYECPMMSRGEIVAILNESQIGNISENDLSKPNFDFVSDLYTRLLFHIDCLHEYSSYLYSIPSLFSHFSLRFSKSKPKRKTLTSIFFFCAEKKSMDSWSSRRSITSRIRTSTSNRCGLSSSTIGSRMYWPPWIALRVLPSKTSSNLRLIGLNFFLAQFSISVFTG